MDAPNTIDAVRARPGKYLSLLLAEETYCIDVMKIREIVGMQQITPLPRMPEFVKGVINLRGRILTVIDLRVRFKMKQKPATCIVVVESESSAGKVTMGILADEVCEVLRVAAEDLEAVPSMGTKIDTSFLLGITRSNGRLIFLLDTDRALDHEEFLIVEAARTQALNAVNEER